MAKNQVIYGDYLKQPVNQIFGTPYITINFLEYINLDKSSIKDYKIIKSYSSNNVLSSIGIEIIENIFPEDLDLLKDKNQINDIYLLAIFFKDGKKSIIEVDYTIYKAIEKNLI